MDLLKMTRKFCRGAIDEFQAAIGTVNIESGFFKERAVVLRGECAMPRGYGLTMNEGSSSALLFCCDR